MQKLAFHRKSCLSLRLIVVLCALYAANAGRAQDCAAWCESALAAIDWLPMDDCTVQFSLDFDEAFDGSEVDSLDVSWELNGLVVASGMEYSMLSTGVQEGGLLVVTWAGSDEYLNCGCTESISLTHVLNDVIWPCACHPLQEEVNIEFTAGDNCVPVQSALSVSLDLEGWTHVTYDWSIGGGDFEYEGGSNSQSMEPSVLFLDATGYEVAVQLTDTLSGCMTSATAMGTSAHDAPSVSILNELEVCTQEAGTVEVLVNPGNTALTSFAWITDGTEASFLFPAPLTQSYNNAGVHEVVARAENECGVGLDTAFVVAHPSPSLEVSTSHNWYCMGSYVDVEATGEGDFSWSSNSALLNGGQPGDTTARYTVGSQVVGSVFTTLDHGTIQCSTSLGFAIYGFFIPSMTLTADETSCIGTAVDIQANITSYGWDTSVEWILDDTPVDTTWAPTASVSTTSNTSLPTSILPLGAHSLAAALAFEPYPDWLPDYGCTDTVYHELVVQPLPVVTAPSVLHYCNQDFTELLPDGSPAGGWWSADMTLENNALNPSQYGVGLHELTYTYADEFGCSALDSTFMSIVPPVMAQAGDDTTLCASNDLVQLPLMGGFETEYWEGTGITDSTSGLLDLGELDPGFWELIHHVGSGSCATSDTAIWQILEEPVAFLSTEGSVACDGDTVWMNVFAGGGTLAPGNEYTYEWTDEVLVNAAGGAYWIANLAENFAIVGLTVTDDFGCSDDAMTFITPMVLPEISLPELGIECAQDIEIPLLGASPSSGFWEGPGVVDSMGVFNPMMTGVGTFELVYTGQNSMGCINSDTATIEVISAPDVSVMEDISVCEDSNVISLSATSTEAGGWSGPGIAAAGDSLFHAADAGVGEHALIYEVGSGSCAVLDTVWASVIGLPLLTYDSSEGICAGEAASFTISVDGGVAGHDLIWSGTSNVSGSDGWLLSTQVWEEGDLPNISFTVVNEAGCATENEVSWTVYAPPSFSLPATWAVCQSDSSANLPLVVSEEGAWSGPGITDSILNATQLIPGPYLAVYEVIDANGCIGIDSMTVEVSQALDLNLTPPPPVCFGDLNVVLPTPDGLVGVWEGPAIEADTNSIVSLEGLMPGTYAYSFTFEGPACTAVDSVELVVHAVPIVEPISANQFCPDSTVFLEVEASAGTPPFLANWELNGLLQSEEELTLEVAWSIPGVQPIHCVVYDAFGCSGEAQWEVEVMQPAAVEMDSIISVCNQAIALELTELINFNDLTELWFTGEGEAEDAVSSNGLLNPAALSEGMHEIHVLVQPEMGCSALDTLHVQVAAPLFPDAGEDGLACAFSGLHTFDALPINEVLTWSAAEAAGAAALVDSQSGIIDVNALPIGSHEFIVSMGLGTCQTMDTVAIEVAALPQIEMPMVDAQCSGAEIIELQGVQPAGGVWTGLGIVDNASGAFDPALAGVGLHELEYAVSDSATQCESSDMLELEVVEPVPAEFYVPVTVCAGTAVELNAANSELLSSATWWQADTLIGQGVSIEWLSEDDSNIVLRTIDHNGCEDAKMQQVTWEHVPQAEVESSTALGCAPLNVSFQPSTELNDVTWSWFIDGELTSTDSEFESVLEAENDSTVYVVTLELNHACGVYQSQDSLLVLPAPGLDFSNTIGDGCAGDTLVLSVESSFADQLVWSWNDQSSVMADTLEIAWSTPGLYEVQITATHVLNACSTEANWSMEVHALPSFSLSVSDSVGCSPLTTQFSSDVDGVGWDWNWDFGDGITEVAGSDAMHIYNGASDGETMEALATVTTDIGCAASASISIQLHPSPTTEWGLEADESCGVPSEIELESDSSPQNLIHWNVNGELTAIGDSAMVALEELGWNYIEQVIFNEFGCSTSALDSIEVLALPSADLSVGPLMGCIGLEVEVEAFTNGVSAELEITQADNGVYSGEVDSIFILDEAGGYQFTLVTTSDRGCVNVLEFADSVVVFPSPEVYFEANPYAGTATDPHPLNSSWTFENSSDAGQSIWDFGDGSMSSEWIGTHTYQAPGSYEVVLLVVNEWGCSDEWTTTITVEENLQVFIPNAFTPPNAGYSDGVNDGWRPEVSAPELVDRYELRVFNRFGELIWESQDPEAFWIGSAQMDGEFYGMNDVYTWVLRIDSRAQLPATQEWRGHVTLIR